MEIEFTFAEAPAVGTGGRENEHDGDETETERTAAQAPETTRTRIGNGFPDYRGLDYSNLWIKSPLNKSIAFSAPKGLCEGFYYPVTVAAAGIVLQTTTMTIKISSLGESSPLLGEEGLNLRGRNTQKYPATREGR